MARLRHLAGCAYLLTGVPSAVGTNNSVKWLPLVYLVRGFLISSKALIGVLMLLDLFFSSCFHSFKTVKQQAARLVADKKLFFSFPPHPKGFFFVWNVALSDSFLYAIHAFFCFFHDGDGSNSPSYSSSVTRGKISFYRAGFLRFTFFASWRSILPQRGTSNFVSQGQSDRRPSKTFLGYD